MLDFEPTTEELKVFNAIHKFGRVPRVGFIIEQMSKHRFGEPMDIMRILVNQNGKRWNIDTTKGDFIEM